MKKWFLTCIILLTWHLMTLHEYKKTEEMNSGAGAEMWSSVDYTALLA